MTLVNQYFKIVECLHNGPQKKGAKGGGKQLIADDFVKIYPNPASGEVHIRIEAMADNNLTVEVTNMMGQVIEVYSAYGLVDQKVDISNFTSGMYIIKVDVDGDITTHKLMV